MASSILRRTPRALLLAAAICGAFPAAAQHGIICDNGPLRSLPGLSPLVGYVPADQKIAAKLGDLCSILMWETGISLKQTSRQVSRRTYYCEYAIHRSVADAQQWRDKFRERLGVAPWGVSFMDWLPGTRPRSESFAPVTSALRKFKFGSGAALQNLPLHYRERLAGNFGAVLIGVDGRSGDVIAAASDIDALYDASPVIGSAAGAADLIALQNLTESEDYRSFVPGTCSATVSSVDETGWLLKDVGAVTYDGRVPYFVQRDYRVSRDGRIDLVEERRIRALPPLTVD
jgi:hypothetical protein